MTRKPAVAKAGSNSETLSGRRTCGQSVASLARSSAGGILCARGATSASHVVSFIIMACRHVPPAFGAAACRHRNVADAVQELQDKNMVYRCFCSEEELAAQKKRAEELKLPPVYMGKWAKASDEEVQVRPWQNPCSPRWPATLEHCASLAGRRMPRFQTGIARRTSVTQCAHALSRRMLNHRTCSRHRVGFVCTDHVHAHRSPSASGCSSRACNSDKLTHASSCSSVLSASATCGPHEFCSCQQAPQRSLRRTTS
jgi:hypothetical protein